MVDQPTSVTDGINKVIGTTQAGVTLVAALGLTALSRRVWSWFNRSPEETFLIALTTHAAALERAKELYQPPEGVHSYIGDELERIADELTEQANDNIRAAIVQRKWSRTRRAGIGPVGCALGIFTFFVALTQISTTASQSDMWAWVGLIGWAFTSISVIIGFILKEAWIYGEMKQLKKSAQSSTSATAAETGS